MSEQTISSSRLPRGARLAAGIGSLVLAWGVVGFLAAPRARSGDADEAILESATFRCVVSREAKVLAFVDRASGRDWLRRSEPASFASVRQGGRDIQATRALKVDSRMELQFGSGGPVAVLRAETRGDSVVLAVESVAGEDVQALTFLRVPLDLKGRPDEPFAACALSMNLRTRVDALPALQGELRASCEKAYGLVGAKVAMVAAPMDRFLPALQKALSDSSELPVCRVAGPWADGIPFNHGSYLFNFGSLVETNVDAWVEMVHGLGFTQIDNHGGGSFFRFGDMELDRTRWPEGWDGYGRIVSRLHGQGIGSIFHTYAFFIDKRSKYVTPVPDARLDAFRTFTLAEPLDESATEVTVVESTSGMSTVTGFFEHNSVVLHLGDELVTFGGVSGSAPWRFTGLKRGALGTKAARHDRGAKARHLKECFGLFVPDVESTLFEEIAANHADVVNRCEFDGIYLDAIDGSSILRGPEACWYWANKFVVEIQKRLRKPVGMEMSAMWHHFWQYRTRWQAWDFPRRGQLQFLDAHAEGVNGGLRLPLHLGWWTFQAFGSPQTEPSYPELMETLGARLIGWNAGISLTSGVDRQALKTTPLFQRDMEILRTCENLRHAGDFDAAARARLRGPGSEFELARNAAGRTRFRPVEPQAFKASTLEPWSLECSITNRFAAQPARFRIESLLSAGAVVGAEERRLLPLDAAGAGRWVATHAAGIGFRVEPGAGVGSWALVATNQANTPRRGAWGRWTVQHAPTLDLKEHEAIEMELDGDGSGALLALRLESPSHIAYGAVADYYVRLDFTGRRRLTLVETESSRWSDYDWGDGKGLYHLYRESVEFAAVERVAVCLQDVPPGKEVRAVLHQVRALPLRRAALQHPRVSVRGGSLEFPVDVASGGWIEANGAGDCQLYGAKGEPLGPVIPIGSWPVLEPGLNRAAFECGTTNGQARARVVFFPHGEVF